MDLLHARSRIDAYLEYAFHRSETGERIPDPLIPTVSRTAPRLYNYFYMPQGKPSPLARPQKGVAQGTLTGTQYPPEDYAVGATRTVYLYQTPVASSCPLLYCLRWPDYLRRAKFNVIVDNLIAERRVRPFAMAFVRTAVPPRTGNTLQ